MPKTMRTITTGTAPKRKTSVLVTAFTAASVLHWPAWKVRSRWRSCWISPDATKVIRDGWKRVGRRAGVPGQRPDPTEPGRVRRADGHRTRPARPAREQRRPASAACSNVAGQLLVKQGAVAMMKTGMKNCRELMSRSHLIGPD